MACRGPARRHGLYGTARRDPRAPRRARSGHPPRHHGADELPPAGGAGKCRDPRRSRQGLHLALRARPRLPQGDARAARSGSPRAFARRSGISATACSRTARPVLEVALAAKSGIGWQGKHTLLLTREAGSWFFLGEIYTDLPLPVGRAADVALRHLHRLHRRLPDGRHRRAVRARREALHLVPHDRASRQHSRGVATADRQSRLRLRRLPALLSVEPLRAGHGRRRLRRAQRPRRRRPRHAVRVDGRRSSARGSTAARSGGSATSAGRETSPSDSATRRPTPTSSPRSKRARTTPPRSCASTWHGRWAGTGASEPRGVRAEPCGRLSHEARRALPDAKREPHRIS